MVELFLVRHGETQENLDGILQGHLPGRLTANGVRQAETLRQELAGERFDVLLVSDLARTVATARVLNEAFGLPLVTTSLLRERDWGPFTGMDILKARTLIDDRAETVDALFRRARSILEEIGSRHDGGQILVVSHGLFCRVLQAACLGKTLREIPRMDNAEVRRVVLTLPLPLPAGTEETGATAN